MGLGNPEERYQNTRHNAGALWVEFLEKKLSLSWRKTKKFFYAEEKNLSLVLVKPLVFMNQSGEVIPPLQKKFSFSPQELVLVHDELDLPLGKWKLSWGKSSPLHRGVLSVEKALGKKEFWRLRLGVDNRGENRLPGEKYVLENFSSEEREKLKRVFEEIFAQFSQLKFNLVNEQKAD